MCFSETDNDTSEEEKSSSKISCENCKKSFEPKYILIHIGRNKLCKAFYGPKFAELKKKQNRQKVQRFRAKPGNYQKELESKRKSYSRGLEKKNQKKQYYQKVSEEKKKDSALNDL